MQVLDFPKRAPFPFNYELNKSPRKHFSTKRVFIDIVRNIVPFSLLKRFEWFVTEVESICWEAAARSLGVGGIALCRLPQEGRGRPTSNTMPTILKENIYRFF